MKRSRMLLLVLGLCALLGGAVAAAEGFAAHLEAVEQALSKSELAPGQWVLGTEVRSRLQTRDTVAIDLAPFGWAEGFTMRLQDPSADDAIVAAGVALALGRPSIYLVSDRKQLPWFLRDADQTWPSQVAIVEGADPQATLKEKPPYLRPGASQKGDPLPKADTFIGCLMSGLSEAQYAEGRTHLQAIDAALRDKMGSRDNFCEGIRVAGTTSFDKPKEALARDLSAIRNSQRCVFYVYDKEPRPSGMWLEAGVALALERPTVFLVPDISVLPPSLRRAHPTGSARVQVYGSHAELLQTLQKDPASILTP